MNVYIADQIARQHADALLQEAFVARRARLARKAGRARRGVSQSANHDEERSSLRVHVPSAIWVFRPFTAFSTWLAAGQL